MDKPAEDAPTPRGQSLAWGATLLTLTSSQLYQKRLASPPAEMLWTGLFCMVELFQLHNYLFLCRKQRGPAGFGDCDPINPHCLLGSRHQSAFPYYYQPLKS
jgi:hypothetical protein